MVELMTSIAVGLNQDEGARSPFDGREYRGSGNQSGHKGTKAHMDMMDVVVVW
jgi:hypothetical protein